MKLFSNCAQPVVIRIPEGDQLTRFVCEACGTIHNHNPKLVVGCVPEADDGSVLICKRAIEPRHG